MFAVSIFIDMYFLCNLASTVSIFNSIRTSCYIVHGQCFEMNTVNYFRIKNIMTNIIRLRRSPFTTVFHGGSFGANVSGEYTVTITLLSN